MHYGGDYNPEQWPEEVWLEDVRLMKQAGVTMVTVGVFAWSRIQPREGVFEWEWLDRVLDLLHDHGIAVDLATGTASPPPWASTRYPELLPRDENGAVYWPGSRQHYAPSSPVYRRLAAELVREVAGRYAQHPAVVMWHVNNEYGCHLHYDYSDAASESFRDWLERRYGTVAELNRSWGTDFWSQRYGGFDEILPPRRAPYSHNPGQLLDFKRFTSDTLLALFTMERDIIRDLGATQPITTNFMGAFPPVDYWRWAREVDVISDDSYPDPNDPEAFRTAAFSRDLMRSLKPGSPWLVMEQAASEVSWRPVNAPKAPGQLAALSMQAIGHGADGILHFQWRQSRRGSEKFHSAMLPQSGTGTRVWHEVVELGRTLGALPRLQPESGARVALVFDWENWWAIGAPDHPVTFDYAAIVQRWYAALHRHHVSIDIVHPGSELGDYALVVAPQLYLLSDEGAANLRSHVQGGGHLLVSAFSDVVDTEDAFRDGGYLVSLREVLGVSVEEFGPLVPPVLAATGAHGQSHAGVTTPFGTLRGEFFAEELRVLGATVVGTFADGRRQGSPALTTHRAGAGEGIYLATIPDDDGMHAVLGWALERAGVTPELPGLSDRVEVARRGDVLTVINHGDEGAFVELAGVDVVTGEPAGGRLLAPFDWVMVRAPRAEASSR